MRTKKSGKTAPSDIDWEILRLKRQVVKDDAKAHACDQCSVLKIKPLPESGQWIKKKDFCRINTRKGEIKRMKASGCMFWAMIQDRLDFEDCKVRLEQACVNVEYDEQKHHARWSSTHYENLAASIGTEAEEEYRRLGDLMRVLPWRAAARSSSEMGMASTDVSDDFVQILMAYTNVDGFNPGGYDQRSAKVDINIAMPPHPKGVRYHKLRFQWVSFWVSFFALGLPATLGDFGDVTQTYVGAPVNLTPASRDTTELVKQWLRKCEFDHHCGIEKLPSSMPSFLLDVSDLKEVRLVSIPALMRERYIALSYCWGVGKQKIMLNKSNKTELISGLSVQELDLTIQDAVHVARELEFQYLWIDALCIIQDDKHFKAKELGKMGDIYREATFTIIASAAKDEKQGFLSKRPPTLGRLTGPSRHPLPAFKIEAHGKRRKSYFKSPLYLTPWLFDTVEPWYTRAWTFQEFLLSGRRLQYLGNQTTWTCYCGNTVIQDCDGWVGGKAHMHPGYSYAEQETFSDVMAILGHTRSALPEASELLLYWYELVDTYCTRNLSYENDRLPAISGIAKGFATALRDEYVCGLWKSDLPAGLVWAASGPRHLQVPFPHPVPGTMPRPSWSWASLNGQVTWTNPHLKKQKDADFEILGHDLELESPNAPFGEVKGGELRLRGLLMSVTPPSVGNRGVLVVILGRREMPVQLDYLNDPRLSTGSQCLLSVLVIVNTGRSIIEGLLVVEEGYGRYSRVGWFHTENEQPEPSEQSYAEDPALEASALGYRAQLRSLWERNVQEVVLI
ncbi:hypothetical protein CH063_01458 [Colletotrichum higginsianum]|uniref:Het domain containing protein n=1 Tax=Colletotrichum higginsianum (strain IMI 349063) TaxID=759273 RepID=H1V7M8_COLHI|nr:Het domain containing protein [Colletotrichum higginsianum IMI 349063]OBR12947.1 Het domain containing protein [Colletotrichum higginsianum IMI 349063]CCF36230.1 hypothetical protein CH063_01458 [Colletotrichum higginsianum]